MNFEAGASAPLWSWIPAAATIGGVLLGFGLSRIPARRERRRKAAGYLRGIDAEIDYAIEHARKYVTGENGKRVIAPAYRMLTRFGIDGTAWLASEGFLTGEEMRVLLAYVSGVEQFNRCLDEAAVLTAPQNKPEGLIDKLMFETSVSTRVQRATLKAGNLCTGDPPAGTAITARAAIQAAADRARLNLAD